MRIDRRGAWVLLAAAVGLLAVLTATLIPWGWSDGLALRPPRAGEVFTEEQLRRAESHARALRAIGWSSYALGVLLALLLGFTRAGAAVVRRATGRLAWWAAVPLAALGLLLAGRLLTLPLALLARERNLRDGLTNQSIGGWLTDQVLSLLVSWALLSVLLMLFVGLARRAPRWWFAWCAAVLVAVTFAVSLLYPLVVEPLFNDFEPLPDGALRTSVLALADAQGLEVDEVLVSDASRRTTTLNAYVSGLAGTRRIVLYDNLLADATPDEVLSVVAHELAHARHHDVVVGTGLGALGVVAGVAALALLLDAGAVRRRAGVAGPADPAAVALMAALVTLAGVLSAPAQNAVSRAVEARADRTAIEATGDPGAFRAVQRRLAVRSLADPTPPWLGYTWFASHPTVLQRLAIADALDRSGRPGR